MRQWLAFSLRGEAQADEANEIDAGHHTGRRAKAVIGLRPIAKHNASWKNCNSFLNLPAMPLQIVGFLRYNISVN